MTVLDLADERHADLHHQALMFQGRVRCHEESAVDQLVPRALEAVGEAVGGADGERLTRVSVELLLGAPWSAAWAGTSDGLRPVAECLEAAWVHGAAPGPALRARAGVIRRDRRRDAREAAGRLGVHLVLPLGLCFLPAFVLLGLVPVMVSLASGFAL